MVGLVDEQEEPGMATTQDHRWVTEVDGLDEVRSELKAKRSQLLDALASDPSAEVDQIAGSPGETEHLSLSVERGLGVAIETLQRKALTEVELALSRLDSGTYGTCEQCGATIPLERLHAIPETAVCVRCG
jgi:DnaK suppressor protein